MSLESLSEVVPFRAAALLPQSPAGLSGVMSLRGVVLSVADLAAVLGLPAAAERPAGFVLVVRGSPFPLGFLVDDVVDVLRIPSGGISRPAEAETALPLRFVEGFTADQTVVLSMSSLLTHPLISDKETDNE